MATQLLQLNPIWQGVVFFVAGLVVGNVLCRCIVRLTEPQILPTAASEGKPFGILGGENTAGWPGVPIAGCVLVRRCERVYRGEPIGQWWLLVELGTGALFAAFAIAYLQFRCEQTLPEVDPPDAWVVARLFYHLILISLLIIATGTDLRDYSISDWVTGTGVFIGVAGAAASGYLQMMHVWVDWNDLLAELYGPYLPEWIKIHPHLHGLCWSLCGLAIGGGLTWLVRILSKLILGREAMGFGDVTLMAMIGSFIGWQPVLFVFLLAPLCGLAMSIPLRLLSGRTFLPYGPYLSAAAVIVLFYWGWIWTLRLPISADRRFSVRLLMGDWLSLAVLAGISLGGLTLLLSLVRLYRMLPVGGRRNST